MPPLSNLSGPLTRVKALTTVTIGPAFTVRPADSTSDGKLRPPPLTAVMR